PASGATSGGAPAGTGPTGSAPQTAAPPSAAAPPVPERRSATTPASPAPRSTPSAASDDHQVPVGAGHRDAADGGAGPAWLELASGSQVGGAFAAGVLAALALGRLRRRRGYRPSAPAPGLYMVPSDVTPTVGELRRRVQVEADSDGAAPPSPAVAPVLPGRGPARLDPALVEAGRSDAGVVHLRLTGWGGLALVGQGAEAVARAWLAALITRAGPYGAQVLGPAGDVGRLLPGAAPAPGVCTTAGVEEALALAEAELLGRSRRLADAEAPDAAAYRRANPEDPLPVLIVVTDAVPGELAGRWRATLAAGRDLDIDALLIAAADPPSGIVGAWVRLDGEGTVLQAHPGALADELAGTRAFRLDATEATDLLGPVIAAQRETDSGTGPGDSGRPEPDLPAGDDLTPEREREPDDQGEARDIEAAPAGQTRSGGRTASDEGPITGEAPPAPLDAWPGAIPTRASHATPVPLVVRLLGPYRITAWGEEVRSGLRASSRELLAWYLLHPEGASAEAVLEDLAPGIDPDKVSDRFWTALGNLRTRLHGPHKRQGIEVLVKTGDAYRPQAEVFEVDVWDFEHALRQASRAANPDELTAALQAAVEAYRGDLLEGVGGLWAEPIREDLHRRALDAHLRLAEVREQSGELDRAADVLERAVVLDPLAEEAYRRLMDALARLGRRDAARRAWARLQGRLAELELEPEAATISLARRLCDAGGSRAPSRQPEPRPRPPANPVRPVGAASASNRRRRP
ncbi:MAG: AfsR/SARP family transcriptional regulator, partial [Acidimicrobiales bacterium]